MVLPQAKQLSASQAPVIDLSPLGDGTIGGREVLAHRIVEACRDIGFFYIVNHGVPPDLVKSMFASAEEFFSLPLEEKMEISMTLSRDYRGYMPIRMIGDGAGLKGSLYESFHMWPDCSSQAVINAGSVRSKSPNVWPRRMPQLQGTMLAYAGQIDRIAVELATLFALGLDLPAGAFLKFFTDPIVLLRFLHYPAQEPTDFEDRISLRPHTDSGGFTVLAQDNLGGLEIQTRGGEWIAVPPVQDSFVINLGEMMKVWSDGMLMATPHRVVNRQGRPRYSIPFFYYADADAPLQPIIKNPNLGNEPVFHSSLALNEEITAGEHLARMHRKIWPSADVQQTT